MNAKHTGFATGVALFAFAGYISKVISFFYRIPYQNIAGDLGLYAYQTVYPFAAIVTSLGVYAMPVVIAKVGAIEQSERQRSEVLWASFYVLFVVSVGLTCLFWLFAPAIARALGDPGFVPVLRIIGIGYLLMPALAVLRGSFQSRDDLRPSASSQIIENAIRVTCMLLVLSIGVRLGRDVYTLSALAHASALVGGVGALLFLMWRARSRLSLTFVRRETMVASARLMFSAGFAIGFASLGILWMQFLDSFTIINLLGGSIEAKTAKGALDRGYPLLQFAVLFATALGMGNVPFLVKQFHEGDHTKTASGLRSIFRVTLIVSLAATVGLVGVMLPLNMTFFGDADGTWSLIVLAATTTFASLAIVGMTCLQALDEEWKAAYGMVYGMIAKLSLSLLLVPTLGLVGAAFSTMLAFAVVALYNVRQVKRVVDAHVSLRIPFRSFLIPLVPLSVFLVAMNGWIIVRDLGRADAFVILLLSVFIGAVLVIWMWLRERVFDETEWDVIPFGIRILNFWNGKGER